MEKITMRFMSNSDQLIIYGLLITPEHPKAVLQISHGMCEHKERYIPFMEYMAKRGYACMIHDHRGHGESIRDSKDLGYFYKNGGEYLVEDLHMIARTMKDKYRNIPYFLFGHSMGSMVVRCYAKKYDKMLDGLIVCGCPSKNSMANLGLVIDKVVKTYRGDHGRSKIVNHLFFGNFQKPFKKEKLKNSWICSDQEVVKWYNDNPLCNFTFTLNGYETLIWLSNNTYSVNDWAMDNPNLPIHFISGEQDSCMISKEKFTEAVELMKQVGYKQVTSQLYEGMRHEVLNEIGKEKVYEDVAAFYDGLI